MINWVALDKELLQGSSVKALVSYILVVEAVVHKQLQHLPPLPAAMVEAAQVR